jgi:hypothetical protein
MNNAAANVGFAASVSLRRPTVGAASASRSSVIRSRKLRAAWSRDRTLFFTHRIRPHRASNATRPHAIRPNHSSDSDAPATISIAASKASSAVNSVSRVCVCRREPSFW